MKCPCCDDRGYMIIQNCGEFSTKVCLWCKPIGQIIPKRKKEMEFKPFGEIKHLTKIKMTITQKIHGTNAQIHISEDGEIRAGSRTRWIFPGDDNYGFAAWVEANKEELIAKLGPGTHYGEWAGPGINSGEGLSERTLVLFNHGRYVDLPAGVVTVPVLYEGPIDLNMVHIVMQGLLTNGSRLVPGFMRPEGVVVSVMGTRLKKVFDAEETQWKKVDKVKVERPPGEDYSHLCQPIRLEKLLSRDEAYVRDFPRSLPQIVKDYVADLIKEEQIVGDKDQVKAVTKGASRQLFEFCRTCTMEKINA